MRIGPPSAARFEALRMSAARFSRKAATGSTTQYHVGRGDSSQGRLRRSSSLCVSIAIAVSIPP